MLSLRKCSPPIKISEPELPRELRWSSFVAAGSFVEARLSSGSLSALAIMSMIGRTKPLREELENERNPATSSQSSAGSQEPARTGRPTAAELSNQQASVVLDYSFYVQSERQAVYAGVEMVKLWSVQPKGSHDVQVEFDMNDPRIRWAYANDSGPEFDKHLKAYNSNIKHAVLMSAGVREDVAREIFERVTKPRVPEPADAAMAARVEGMEELSMLSANGAYYSTETRMAELVTHGLDAMTIAGRDLNDRRHSGDGSAADGAAALMPPAATPAAASSAAAAAPTSAPPPPRRAGKERASAARPAAAGAARQRANADDSDEEEDGAPMSPEWQARPDRRRPPPPKRARSREPPFSPMRPNSSNGRTTTIPSKPPRSDAQFDGDADSADDFA